MFIPLRPGLYHRQLGADHIFFDLPADRYFLLPPKYVRTWERYLTDKASHSDLSRLRDWNLIARDNVEGRSTDLPPRTPTSSLFDTSFAGVSFASAAWTIWVQRRARGDLRRRGIYRIVQQLERDGLASLSCDDGVASDVTVAFRAGRRYVSAADQCLVRGIAMKRMLARRGCSALLVFGVTMPFSAHCWVQAGESVLTDPLDVICRYQPIFSV